jgi:arsenite methyltransferase
MSDYLSYTFNDDETFISTFDEVPLWSASFGLLLLKHLRLQAGIKVIDIGSGAGFPLLELAGRLGDTCSLYGIDPWANANKRARQKIKNYGLKNVEIIDSSAENMPFENNSIDLIVSNLGINNFDRPKRVFDECYRVLKSGGRLALTSNITGHWKEFYAIFEETLRQLNKPELLAILKKEEAHRGTLKSICNLFEESGFNIHKKEEESFEMKFVSGSAFLNHYFVKLGWLSSWLAIFPKYELHAIFTALEQNLNAHANKTGGLNLTVPMLYLEGDK